MKYLLLIVNAEDDWNRHPPADQNRVIDQMNAFRNELKAAGKYVVCGGLAPAGEAKTVRLQSGTRVVQDGLALLETNTRDQITGFFVVEASSGNEAVEWAQRMPIIAGAIEIRPIAME